MMRLNTVIGLLALLAASGCAPFQHAAAPALFDLGATVGQPHGTLSGRTISVAEVSIPTWLDTQAMFYRFDYSNHQQPRPYTTSRWAMPPGQLMAQLVRLRLAEAGATALAATDGILGVPLLRLQVDDFSQHFSSPEASTGRVSLRATVVHGRKVLAQRSFVHQSPAPSADAEGGARALAAASNGAVTELVEWLGTLDLK